MDSLKTQALVLRRTNYGEADRILSLLTPEGKLSAMAKGVRKERSKLAGGIELFGVSDVMLRKGKGDLWVLTSVRLVEHYGEIVKDLAAMEWLGRVFKEAGRRAEQVGESEFFDLVWQVMRGVDGVLNDGSGLMGVVRLWWGLNVLRASGEDVNLWTDASGAKLVVDKKYEWDGMERVLREREHGEVGAEEIKLMRLMVSSKLSTVLRVRGVEKLGEKVVQSTGF